LVALGLFLALTIAPAARAQAFDPQTVPANAKYVLHVNAEAILASPLWEMAKSYLDQNADYQTKRVEIERVAGMRLPEDIHSVTVYGLGFTDKDAVVILDAAMNQQQLRNMLQMNPDYKSTAHGDHEILTWTDKGKINYGAFYGGTKAIIAGSPENVGVAMDILDGKGETFKNPTTLPPNAKGAGVMLFVAADAFDLLKAKEPQNPIAGLVLSVAGTVAHEDGALVARVNLQAKDPQAAEQMRSSIEGLKSFITMLAGNQQAQPGTKLGAEALQKLQASVNQSSVALTWSMPMADIKTMVDKVQALRQGAPAATNPQP
jgi:hypothetical protein